MKQRRGLTRVLTAVRSLSEVFPLTSAGLLISAACAVALFHYGFVELDLILLGVGSVGLGVAVLSLLLTSLAAWLTWRRVRRALRGGDPLRLECAYWAPSGFALPSLWYIPFVQVSWRWLSPLARVRITRKRRRASEEICPDRRDSHSQIVRRFDIGDIFGLCSISFRVTEQRSVRFTPWVGALRQMHVLRGMSGGQDISHPEGPTEGDRYDMRHYVAGDPIRFVLWKVFAKSRHLVVRTPERAISPSKQTVAYLVASDSDEPAAGAARVAVDLGALGAEWLLGADGCPDVAESKDSALDVLARSARATAEQSGNGLGGFLDSVAKSRVGRAVVFVPAKPGPWLDRVISATGAFAGSLSTVEFIVGTDGVSRQKPRSFWSRLWRGPEDPRATAEAEELSKVVSKLTSARGRVVVVDRQAGQIFSQNHVLMSSKSSWAASA